MEDCSAADINRVSRRKLTINHQMVYNYDEVMTHLARCWERPAATGRAVPEVERALNQQPAASPRKQRSFGDEQWRRLKG